MNKKIILFGSFLAVFLMLLIPNVSAIEYQQVKEIQENLMKIRFNNSEEEFSNINLQNIKEKLSKSLTNFDLKKFKGKLKNISIENNLLNSKGIFIDPGNGTDGNGPDDITDWIYGILFFIILPFEIIPLIFGGFMFVILIEYIFISFVFFIPIILLDLIEEWFVLYEKIISLMTIGLSPLILLGEFDDTIDWDEDGR